MVTQQESSAKSKERFESTPLYIVGPELLLIDEGRRGMDGPATFDVKRLKRTSWAEEDLVLESSMCHPHHVQSTCAYSI